MKYLINLLNFKENTDVYIFIIMNFLILISMALFIYLRNTVSIHFDQFLLDLCFGIFVSIKKILIVS